MKYDEMVDGVGKWDALWLSMMGSLPSLLVILFTQGDRFALHQDVPLFILQRATKRL